MLTEADLQAHAARIAKDGYTILENAIEPDLLDGLTEDLRRLETERAVLPAQNLFEGFRTVRIYNLLVHGPRFAQVPTHDNVLPLVERVLDKGCLVSSLSSISICPGEEAQPLHTDDLVIPLPRPHVPIICNTMWALTDFTADNGATRLVPGSHLWESAPELGKDHDNLTIAAQMQRGSVLVWNGSLWHGGGKNRTQTRRIGLAMNYCAGYIRQQENQQLGIPLSIARGFSPRLRKLVGYGLYKRLLGHIDKCSPVDLLDGTGPRRIIG